MRVSLAGIPCCVGTNISGEPCRGWLSCDVSDGCAKRGLSEEAGHCHSPPMDGWVGGLVGLIAVVRYRYLISSEVFQSVVTRQRRLSS